MSFFFLVFNAQDPKLLAQANKSYEAGKCPACGACQSLNFMPNSVMSCNVCLCSFICKDVMENPDAQITACLGVIAKDEPLHQRYLAGDLTDKLTARETIAQSKGQRFYWHLLRYWRIIREACKAFRKRSFVVA